MDLKLRNRVALVSGASRGIGLATAQLFADEGCHLGICGRDQEHLQEAKKDLEGRGAKVTAVQADVTQPGDAARFVDRCVEELGGIDILVNNVGGSAGGQTIFETSDEYWHRTFDLTLLHGVRLARLAAPHMQGRSGGAIVNVASISGWSPQLVGTAQYGAAKASVIFLTERLALELVRFNIRVNTVSPGSIQRTQGWDNFKRQNPDSFETYVREGFPMGRLGNPEEVADVIVFLASPRANWINGRHIPVDGLEQPTGVVERRPW